MCKELSPPHCNPRGLGQIILAVQTRDVKGRPNVRFGSKADMCSAKRHVRFTPNSDRESRHAAMVMSALPLKADSCSAATHVRFGPKQTYAAQQETAYSITSPSSLASRSGFIHILRLRTGQCRQHKSGSKIFGAPKLRDRRPGVRAPPEI